MNSPAAGLGGDDCLGLRGLMSLFLLADPEGRTVKQKPSWVQLVFMSSRSMHPGRHLPKQITEDPLFNMAESSGPFQPESKPNNKKKTGREPGQGVPNSGCTSASPGGFVKSPMSQPHPNQIKFGSSGKRAWASVFLRAPTPLVILMQSYNSV